MGDVNNEQQPDVTEEQAPEEKPLEQEQAAEEAAPEESEAPETEASEEDGGGEQAEGEPEKASEEQAEEKRRRRTGYARKLEAKDRQIAALIEQLQRTGQKPAEPAKEQTPEEKTAAYLDSLVEQRIQAREEQRRQQEQVAAFQKRTAEFRAKTPDFDEAIEAVADIEVPREVQEAILTSEHNAEIMYLLAKSPAELARISALPPLLAARELGRLEAKLASGAAAPAKPKAPIRPPAPPTNVSGKTGSTRDLADLPIADFKRALRSGKR